MSDQVYELAQAQEQGPASAVPRPQQRSSPRSASTKARVPTNLVNSNRVDDSRVDELTADVWIQGALGLKAPADGVTGNVVFCTDEEFAEAIFHNYLRDIKETPTSEDEERLKEVAKLESTKINGVTGNDGKIYLKKKVANQGLLIHEGIHKYGADAFVKDLCQGDSAGFNEGMTEYFTRLVTKPRGLSRHAYASELKTAESVVRLVGRETAQAAYFAGDVDAFKVKFQQQAGQDWDKRFKATQLDTKNGNPVTEAHYSSADALSDGEESYGLDWPPGASTDDTKDLS